MKDSLIIIFLGIATIFVAILIFEKFFQVSTNNEPEITTVIHSPNEEEIRKLREQNESLKKEQEEVLKKQEEMSRQLREIQASKVNDVPPKPEPPNDVPPKPETRAKTRFEFENVLKDNSKLKSYYDQLLTIKYRYFKIGMDVWKGQKSSQDYRSDDSFSLAKAVETLRYGINNPNALQQAKFQNFYDAVVVNSTSTNIVESKKTIKASDRAHFVGTLFQGLWHFERKEYGKSYEMICQPFLKYSYTKVMNRFSKELMIAISVSGNLGKPNTPKTQTDCKLVK